jgi:hypothetical protein
MSVDEERHMPIQPEPRRYVPTGVRGEDQTGEAVAQLP